MPTIKYPRVEVSVKHHGQLKKMAKQRKTTNKAIVARALSLYFSHQ